MIMHKRPCRCDQEETCWTITGRDTPWISRRSRRTAPTFVHTVAHLYFRNSGVYNTINYYERALGVVNVTVLFSARLYSVQQEGGHRRLASSALSMLTLTAASYLDPGLGLEWVRNGYNDGERCTEIDGSPSSKFNTEIISNPDGRVNQS
jgi:hypothetical protein